MRASAGVALVLLVLAAAGCASGTNGVAPANADRTAGKRLFTEKCGACHTLRDAGTKGTIGPNLDHAFGPSRKQGFKESTVRQVVRDQIEFAGNYGLKGPTMPKNLVTGSDADDVAAYVAYVAGTTNTVSAPAAPPPAPPSSGGGGGANAAGKKAFTDNGCVACHTLTAAGSHGTVGPDLDKIAQYAKTAGQPLDAFIRESIVDPNKYIEKGYPKGVMPETFGSLPPATIDALVKFISGSSK
jgi:cytochrome c2